MKLLILISLLFIISCESTPKAIQEAKRPIIVKACSRAGVVLTDGSGTIYTYDSDRALTLALVGGGVKAGDTIAKSDTTKSVTVTNTKETPVVIAFIITFLFVGLIWVWITQISTNGKQGDMKKRLREQHDMINTHGNHIEALEVEMRNIKSALANKPNVNMGNKLGFISREEKKC